jgi:NADH-quinone oxidoreductase subunit C
MADKGFDEALSGLEAGVGEAARDAAPRTEAADPASHPSVAALRARFHDAILHHAIVAGDEHVVFVAPERVREVCRWLHQDDAQRYDLLADLTAVDYGGGRPLEVVYQLWSVPHRRALRLKAALPVTALEIDSVVEIWQTANWLERETWDMFGIHFRDHPDLRRIMMPDNYAEGHPLRKDFPLRGRFSRAEQTRRSLTMSVEDFYTPDELEVGGGVAHMPPVEADPGRMPDRPNDVDWSPGSGGSAAGGAPGPQGAGS